jgi:hypothetical protein
LFMPPSRLLAVQIMANKKRKPEAARKPSVAAGSLKPLGAAVVAIAVVAAGAAHHFARQPADAPRPMASVACASYPDRPGCSPRGAACGSVVVDDFASAAEVEALVEIAARGMALGGGAGGPTILDLQSGALSYGDKFVDVWSLFNATAGARAYRRSELRAYADVVDRVRRFARRQFGVSAPLHLTAPTFFSRLSGDKPAITRHDEYWHTHVDLEQYGSFVFTALLYLSTKGDDFEGGSFEFLPRGTSADQPAAAPAASVDPKKGRLVLFTSGAEHPHRVTRVTKGTRLALTIAFTCDQSAALNDFLTKALPDE